MNSPPPLLPLNVVPTLQFTLRKLLGVTRAQLLGPEAEPQVAAGPVETPSLYFW